MVVVLFGAIFRLATWQLYSSYLEPSKGMLWTLSYETKGPALAGYKWFFSLFWVLKYIFKSAYQFLGYTQLWEYLENYDNFG